MLGNTCGVHLYGPSFVDSIDYEKIIFIRTEWTIPQEPITLESFSQYQQLKLKDKTGAFGVTLIHLRYAIKAQFGICFSHFHSTVQSLFLKG